MTGVAEHLGFPAMLALLLVVAVIIMAVYRNYHVRTGFQFGWFRFFLETDREQPAPKNEAAPPLK
jgi:hypothetical protein